MQVGSVRLSAELGSVQFRATALFLKVRFYFDLKSSPNNSEISDSETRPAASWEFWGVCEDKPRHGSQAIAAAASSPSGAEKEGH
jgi:hypothetical protein